MRSLQIATTTPQLPPAVVARLLARAVMRVRALGGPGSGNFGHAGRPGQVGGSSDDSISVVEHENGRDLEYELPDGQGSLLVRTEHSDEVSDQFKPPKDFATVSMVAIKQSAQGKGNAYRLYKKAIADLKDRGFEGIASHTGFRQPLGEKLWQSFERHGAKIERHGMWEMLRFLGGPGSGHYGHAGRPGEVGGSSTTQFPTGLTKISGPRGTNPGGVYTDDAGKKWYVKQYRNSDQAANENVANAVYRAVGVPVPASALSDDGKQIALRWEESRGTLGETGVDQEVADKILDGFVADVFVQNWDAVGTGHDNVIVKASGTPLRVDQGGSLLFRAQGSPKPESTLDQIDEWDTLQTRNVYYNEIFKSARVKNADALGDRAVRQIDRIVAARPRGGWESLVREHAPRATETFKARVGQMLEARQAALEVKREQLVARLRAAGFNPDQPRIPAGDPDGGKWTSGAGGAVKKKAPKAAPVSMEAKQAAYDEVKAGATFKATAAKHGMTQGQLAGYVWKTDQKKNAVQPKVAAPIEAPPVPKAWADLSTQEKLDLAMSVEDMKWQEKTTGLKKGQYAWFDKHGTQVSAPFANKTDHRAALDTINQGKGIAVPEVNKIGFSPSVSKTPAAVGDWPLSETVERKLGSQYPEAVRTNYDQWQKSLSAKELSTIRDYTGASYVGVNEYLRGKDTADEIYGSYAKTISKALDRAPSPPPPDLVWRGTDSETVAKMVANVSPGSVIKLDGFQSSSIKPKFAKSWGERTIFEVKPAKGAYIRPFSIHSEEYEYLLPHGSNYTVRGISYVKFEDVGSKVRVIQLVQHK